MTMCNCVQQATATSWRLIEQQFNGAYGMLIKQQLNGAYGMLYKATSTDVRCTTTFISRFKLYLPTHFAQKRILSLSG